MKSVLRFIYGTGSAEFCPGYRALNALLLFTLSVSLCEAASGGLSLGKTRIVYPADASSATIEVDNNSESGRYLVQSWVEKGDAKGEKSADFLVTPPLYKSEPGDANTLKIIKTTPTAPADREQLYYFVSRFIPEVDKSSTEKKNVVLIGTAMKIKLFLRPVGLKTDFKQAVSGLRFHRAGNGIKAENPGPYYLTLVDINSGSKTIADFMLPPRSTQVLPLPVDGKNVSFQVINDYGGLTDRRTVAMEP